MSRIDRIRRAVSAQNAPRTAESARAGSAEAGADEAFEAAGANLPVPVGPVVQPRSFRDERRHPASEFATQLIGQDGERRGLRGGASVIQAARSAYNRTEWSGAYDRRAPKGAFGRTEV